MILFSSEEIADFIWSCADLSKCSQDEIAQALEDWREHMIAGGYDVGTEIAHKADTQDGGI